MIALTHTEAVTVVKVKAAIAAMSDLVLHLNQYGDDTGLVGAVRARIVEADYLLNSAEDYHINDDPEMLLVQEAP